MYSSCEEKTNAYNQLIRFRHVPSFGRSTIRRIRANTSALKKLAARDFEDYLQVSIPRLRGNIRLIVYAYS